MRILVLNGSPKRERSDTLRITRAFLAGMEEAARQEKCGMQYSHFVEKELSYLGVPRDLSYYAIQRGSI